MSLHLEGGSKLPTYERELSWQDCKLLYPVSRGLRLLVVVLINGRLNFLQQCSRVGTSQKVADSDYICPASDFLAPGLSQDLFLDTSLVWPLHLDNGTDNHKYSWLLADFPNFVVGNHFNGLFSRKRRLLTFREGF